MSQNADSSSTTLPTARKARRAHSQHNRPVLVSSTSQGIQESEGTQVETLEPENSHVPAHTESLAEVSATPETPEVSAKARRSRLPSFFSKVEKTVEEPGTSQEEVVKARLARAQKTTSKTEVASAVSQTKESDRKPVRETNRTAAATTRPKLFKTRHFFGMMIYLLGAETLLPIEANFSLKAGIDHPGHPIAAFTLFNIPMQIMPSTLLNLATLIALLLILVKIDLLPSSMGARRTAATVRGQQQQREQGTVVERPPQQTVRQGVKGEYDDLYNAYRSNQRREKKH